MAGCPKLLLQPLPSMRKSIYTEAMLLHGRPQPLAKLSISALIPDGRMVALFVAEFRFAFRGLATRKMLLMHPPTDLCAQPPGNLELFRSLGTTLRSPCLSKTGKARLPSGHPAFI